MHPYLTHEVVLIKREWKRILFSLLTNAAITLFFAFLALKNHSYIKTMFQFAPAILTAWTFSDTTFTNQYEDRSLRSISFLSVLTRAMLWTGIAAIFFVLYAVIFLAITHDLHQLMYGFLAFVSGWPGWISLLMYMSVCFPFSRIHLKQLVGRSIPIKSLILTGVPFILLPIYVAANALVYLLLHTLSIEGVSRMLIAATVTSTVITLLCLIFIYRNAAKTTS